MAREESKIETVASCSLLLTWAFGCLDDAFAARSLEQVTTYLRGIETLIASNNEAHESEILEKMVVAYERLWILKKNIDEKNIKLNGQNLRAFLHDPEI